MLVFVPDSLGSCMLLLQWTMQFLVEQVNTNMVLNVFSKNNQKQHTFQPRKYPFLKGAIINEARNDATLADLLLFDTFGSEVLKELCLTKL